jgi:hypothetical protein
MVLDKFQRGQEIREQRSGRSSNFLIGTVEAAHRVVPFLNRLGLHNEKCNNRNMLMTYDRTQSRPSPLGMRSYESINPNSPMFGTDMIIDHDQIDVSSQPCFTGNRV